MQVFVIHDIIEGNGKVACKVRIADNISVVLGSSQRRKLFNQNHWGVSKEFVVEKATVFYYEWANGFNSGTHTLRRVENKAFE